MSAVPPPSRRVLTELHAEHFVTIDAAHAPATPVAHAWLTLDAALDAHAAALAAVDRLAAALVAAHGHPRVALPTPPGAAPLYAVYPATIERHVADPVTARRLRAALRRRRRSYARGAAALGLPAAQEREAMTAATLADATAALLRMPATSRADLALQLAVLIAAGEAGPPEAAAFPWLHLRRLLPGLIDAPAL